MEDVWFVGDLKHGVALFSGSHEEMEGVRGRLKRNCHTTTAKETVASDICLFSYSNDVDKVEMEYILKELRLPRRVAIRLRKKVCELS